MSENSLYIPGEVARITVRILNTDGVAADPGTLVLIVKPPAAAVISYIYGVAPEIVRDGTGAYHADVPLTGAGQWMYRWETTPPNAGAVEGSMSVQKSRVI